MIRTGAPDDLHGRSPPWLLSLRTGGDLPPGLTSASRPLLEVRRDNLQEDMNRVLHPAITIVLSLADVLNFSVPSI